MSDLVQLTADGDTAIITVNNPPVNALSPGVPEGISAGVESAQADDRVRAIVLIGGGRTFIAGADIHEFAKVTAGERPVGSLHDLLAVLENGSKPVVCAIHGTAFGGGLEVALACHHRVAVASAQCGQPEVKLGIIPGAGGTQRLPRLVGVVKAAEMCALGTPVPATEACELGLIDQLIEGDLLDGAVKFARTVAESGQAPVRTRDRRERLEPPEAVAASLEELRRNVGRRFRGQPAPLKAIEAVEAAATCSFEEGLELEAALFKECLFSDASKALIHVFFGERTVRKIPDIPADTQRLEIAKAAVVGAGTMGSGIAMSYANAGIPVILKEVDRARLDQGVAMIRRNYEKTMKKGRLTADQVEQRLGLITPTVSYDGFEAADIIVEAVFESMELKKRVFGELDRIAKDDAILASNTSTLDIDEIASATRRPEMVIGHHFFSPANVMRLLEIVRTGTTSDRVIATSMALAQRLRKVGVLVRNCVGFVGNRMFGPYMREAEFLIEEGASVEGVDTALYDFGMAMGPLAVGDLAGLDVGQRIRKEHAHLIPKGMRQPVVAEKLCELGRFGQKTGSGWYKYDTGDRRPTLDPEVEALVSECRSASGREPRDLSPTEIIERTIYTLVNEGAKVLGEGFAQRAIDIDIIYVYGFGFPAHRGGPMFYADTVGLDVVLGSIRQFERKHGFWWKPAELLEKLVAEGKSFSDLDRRQQ